MLFAYSGLLKFKCEYSEQAAHMSFLKQCRRQDKVAHFNPKLLSGKQTSVSRKLDQRITISTDKQPGAGICLDITVTPLGRL